MEEEIIMPEEETFEYNKLRYILDNESYLLHASLGGLIVCDLGECTEYTGEVPKGYGTIEEWFDGEIEKLNAWKIVNGNLEYDVAREAELKRKCKCEEEENSYATQKYVNEQFKSVNTIYDDELSSNIEGSSLFTIDNTKATEIVEMLLTPKAEIKQSLKIKITNENMLGIKPTNKEENGLTFEVNEDRSITIEGTATADTEYILNGTLNSTDILFFFRKNQDYMQCGLPKNVKINLYSYDGTDRNLISSMGNGTINLSSTAHITYVTLSIAKGSKFEDVTIFPMIKVGTYSSNTKYEYIPCEENDILTIDLEGYTFDYEDTILIDRSNYTFTKNFYLFPSDDLFPNDDIFPYEYKEEIRGYINTQKSFKGKTLIQCDKDVTMKVKYFTDDYLNKKFAQIQVREDEIVAEVSRTYTTKEETAIAKTEAIESANNSTDEKLEDYSTTVEMNSAINQKADSITSSVSKTYTTKTETATAKQEAIDSANTSTDNKLKNYSTTTEMNSAITQKADEINLEVGKKVNNEDFTGANIMLAINDDSSSATINADKISLNGKTFDLTSDEINIDSEHLDIDTIGNVTITSDTGGAVNAASRLTVQTSDGTSLGKIFPNILLYNTQNGTAQFGVFGYPRMLLKNEYSGEQIQMLTPNSTEAVIYLGDSYNNTETVLARTGITTPTVTQTSLAEQKKNIEKLQGNAIDIIKNIDIYKYNLKSENDTDKKHIGFVIGEDYNYSEEVTSLDNKGVDNYSFTSLCCKAIQEQQKNIEEQQKIIEDLQKEIKELKEAKQ